MKKIGVIDIGTNSMRMLVGQVKNGKVLTFNKSLQTTRLGEGINQGTILSSALDRNIHHLMLFKKQAIEEGVEEFLVFGTSALRDAKNSGDFIQRAKDQLGLSVKVLSGEEEGMIGFIGATQDLSKEAIIIDIGGGSTELIVGNKKEGFSAAHSIDIGALRLTKGYVNHDPITREEVSRIEKVVVSNLKGLPRRFCPKERMDIIGIGGTITSLAAIKQGLKTYERSKVHHSILLKEDLDIFLEETLPLPIEERGKIQGLHPGRADIIIAGTIILKEIMKWLGTEKIIVSDSDNLEGMLYYHLTKIRIEKNF